MSKPYDDTHYAQWVLRLGDLVSDYLDTEGNTVETLQDEVDNAVENFDSSA